MHTSFDLSDRNKEVKNHSQTKKNQLRRKDWLGSLLTLLLIAGGGSTILWAVNSNQKETKDFSEYMLSAESGSLPGLITASGELQAKVSVNLSPKKTGLIEELYVKEGQEVKEGQPIALMESGDYLYRQNELKAEYLKQKAAYDRRKSLFQQGAVSSEQLDEFRNRFLSIEARLKQIGVEGKDLLVKAPFTGIITTRYAEPGSFVAPTTRASSVAGSTSSSIVELSKGLQIVSKVPENDIGRILIGQKATVRFDSFPEERFLAKVIEIAPRSIKSDNVTSFEVKLSINSPPEKLRIGMTTDIDFQTGKTKISTLVPTVAIVTEDGKPGVLVLGKNDKPKFQEIELGTSSGSKTAILKGLSPGDQIFIDIPPWIKTKRD